MRGAPKLNGYLGREHSPEVEATLEEFLKEFDPGVNVAIGAATSFFYIGLIKNFEYFAPVIDSHYSCRAAMYYYKRAQREQKTEFDEPAVYRPFIPFAKRKVKRYWSRHLKGEEPPMWIIEVEGLEAGEFWTLAEFNQGMIEYYDDLVAATKTHTKKSIKLAE